MFSLVGTDDHRAKPQRLGDQCCCPGALGAGILQRGQLGLLRVQPRVRGIRLQQLLLCREIMLPGVLLVGTLQLASRAARR